MTRPARIPSDVYRADRVVGPLTARQAAILVDVEPLRQRVQLIGRFSG